MSQAEMDEFGAMFQCVPVEELPVKYFLEFIRIESLIEEEKRKHNLLIYQLKSKQTCLKMLMVRTNVDSSPVVPPS